MNERFNVRLPKWMADAIKDMADADPQADGKVGRTMRNLMREALDSRGIVPHVTKAATKGDKIGDKQNA